jgi:hypothetical protein
MLISKMTEEENDGDNKKMCVHCGDDIPEEDIEAPQCQHCKGYGCLRCVSGNFGDNWVWETPEDYNGYCTVECQQSDAQRKKTIRIIKVDDI